MTENSSLYIFGVESDVNNGIAVVVVVTCFAVVSLTVVLRLFAPASDQLTGDVELTVVLRLFAPASDQLTGDLVVVVVLLTALKSARKIVFKYKIVLQVPLRPASKSARSKRQIFLPKMAEWSRH